MRELLIYTGVIISIIIMIFTISFMIMAVLLGKESDNDDSN